MPTLEEVIQYCIDTSNCNKQRQEYRELAGQIPEWLEELKARREKDFSDCRQKMVEVQARMATAQMYSYFNKF